MSVTPDSSEIETKKLLLLFYLIFIIITILILIWGHCILQKGAITQSSTVVN